MANKWNIPKAIEQKIRHRDTRCVYCRDAFASNAKEKATWEHIDNDVSNTSENNICLCCNSCNASKGMKKLQEWLTSEYCQKRGINKKTVAEVVQRNINSR